MTDEIIAYDFGVRLRQLREGKGLSRVALAKKLDVSKETIYRYENNLQTPSLDNARRLALILNTSLDYLVGLDDAYTIRLPHVSDQQKSVLNEFIKTFVK